MYYKLNDEDTWYRIGDGEQNVGTNDDTAISIDDLESLFVKNNKSFKRGDINKVLDQTDASHMGYSVSRNNSIELAISDSFEKASVPNADFKAVTQFNFNLKVDGTLEVTVPKNLNMGTELLGREDSFVQKVKVNEVKTPYKKISALTNGVTPLLTVYNPMKYPFKLSLARLDEDKSNPFTELNNFSYQLTDDDPNDNDYLSVVNGTDNSIAIINREVEENGSKIKPQIYNPSENSLQSTMMYFNMPYNDSYKVGDYISKLTWNLQ